MARKGGNPRNANGSRRRALRSRVRAMGLPCALCGRPIDYSLPAGDPMAYELDEIVPVSRGGSPYDPDNVQPAHRRCNQAKGDAVDRKGGAAAFPHSSRW
ncbi:HNH endonuclease [Eggerthellaceae bacterium zg-893]|nr:HNH endonuclease [Eggerthellaceae bacterium zg-893]